MHQDRQVFVERYLNNGIRTFHYPDQTPYTSISVCIPTGSAHSTGTIIPGTFHFLEHMVMKRSKAYPGMHEFHQLVGLKGGTIKASTGPFNTTYTLEVPTEYLEETLLGFFSLIYTPIFNEEDIAKEQGVINSERSRKERWFPSISEEQQYVVTKWQYDCPLSLRQRLGFNEDLQRIGVEELINTHRFYSSSNTWIMSGGSGDPTPFYDMMDQANLPDNPAPESYYDPIRWLNQDYHEKAFRDVSRYNLRYGSIVKPRPDARSIRAIDFILAYLMNSVHGPLYRWLREERGWVYDLNWSTSTSPFSHDFALRFPLANLDQVQEVRDELEEQISRALENENSINLEVNRILSKVTAYSYLNLNTILNDGRFSFDTYGRILPEKEWLQIIERCRDAAFLREVWSTYSQPKNVGCFCATPSIK